MSDSRSSLDIIESEDTSLICLSQDLDAHTNHLRNAVLQSVAAIRSKIHVQTAESLDRQRERAYDTERQLLAQIDNLQDLLAIRTEELRVVTEKHERLLTLHQEQKLRAHTKSVAQAALRRWHELVAKKKRNAAACDKLIAQRQERQSRHAFTAWRLASQKQKADDLLQKTIADHRRTTAKLQLDYQATENQVRMEALSLKEKLAFEEQRRDVLEEKLKAAFMRGVCALNLEAMHVLRSAAGAAGEALPQSSGSSSNSAQQLPHDASALASMMLQGLQGANRSNSAKTTESEISSATEDNARSVSNVDMLVAQQAAMNEQLAGGPPAVVTTTIASANTSKNYSTEVSPSAQSAPLLRTTANPVPHQPFTVNVNPNYPAQRGGTTLTSAATRGSTSSSRPTSASSRLLSQRK